MSVSHVLNRIREFPLHEIEIVKNEVIAGTNTRVFALYHIGFCPSEEDVWVYTTTVGTVDESLVQSLISDIENTTKQVAVDLAEEAVADDALLAELQGNEDAMRPEDPGASGAAD